MTGVALVISGAPALASTGLDGPTTPVTGDPLTNTTQNEKQKITLLDATGGTYKLKYTDSGGICYSPAIAYNALDTVVDDAIAEDVGGGIYDCTTVFNDADIAVTGTFPVYTLEFQGATFGNTNMFQWAADTTGSTLLPKSSVNPTNPGRVYVSTVQNGRFGGTDATGQNDTDPHGGYSSTTNYCVQCHAVHSYEYPAGTITGPAEYALMVRQSVTDTCNTCHKLFGSTPLGGLAAVNSNAIVGAAVGQFSMGTTAVRTAYDVTGASRKGGHTLGATSSPLPDGIVMQGLGWRYGSFSATSWYMDNEPAGAGTSHPSANAPADPGGGAGGLYCGSCHTPHGEFGQAINTEFYRSNAGADAISAVQYVFVKLDLADTFRLTFKGQQTAPLPANAPANSGVDNVQDALRGLSTIGAGNVTVTGTPLLTKSTDTIGNYKVTFAGALANSTQAQITATDSNAAAGKVVEVIVNNGGSAAVAEPAPTMQGNEAPTGATLGAVRSFGDDKPIFQYNALNRPMTYYLNQPGDPTTNPTNTGGNASAWERCTTTDAAPNNPPLNCEFLTITDSEGQVVYEYGYKLLTAYPNHSWAKPESWGLGYRGTDSSRWCGSCHASKVSPDFGVEGEYAVNGITYHSHPTACYYCHGNPFDSSTTPSYDFPHTSTVGQLLKAFPDALCISCHTARSLP